MKAIVAPVAAATTISLFASMLLLLSTAAEAGGLSSCTISASSVAFGNYNPLSSAPTDTTGTVTYQCDFVVLPTITLSTGGSSSYAPRQMLSGADTLNYNLYQDATRLLVWGDGTGGSVTYVATVGFLNISVPVTVYGRIPAQQNAPVGVYGDTVVATIHF